MSVQQATDRYRPRDRLNDPLQHRTEQRANHPMDNHNPTLSEEEQKDESQQPKSARSLDPGLQAGRKLETSPGWAAKSNENHDLNMEGGRGSCCLYALYAHIFGRGCYEPRQGLSKKKLEEMVAPDALIIYTIMCYWQDQPGKLWRSRNGGGG